MTLVLQGLQECGTAGGGEGEDLSYPLTVPAQGRDQLVQRQPSLSKLMQRNPEAKEKILVPEDAERLRFKELHLAVATRLSPSFEFGPRETERFSLERTRSCFRTWFLSFVSVDPSPPQ